MKILLFLNTTYHVETVLSIYKSLKLLGWEPTILLDYEPDDTNPNRLDFDLENFLKEFHLDYVTKDQYLTLNKNLFNKCIIISGDVFLRKLTHLKGFYDKNSYIINNFKKSTIFISHVSNYSDLYNQASSYYINIKVISVTQFSQKFNLNYLNQIENIITDTLPHKNFLNKVPKFIVLGRFCWPNRSLNYLEEIIKIDKQISKQINISIVGQKPFDYDNKMSFIHNKYKNINFEIKYDISELEFYKEINGADYILNLIDYQRGFYFLDRFTSNITHTIAFNKPSLCFMPLNLIYNIPCIEYTATDFKDKFLECVNLDEKSYLKYTNQFVEIKNNMRNHNTMVLNNLLK